MARPGEDDREAIDRAFAEMMAGYHLTADRPDPVSRTGESPVTVAGEDSLSVAGGESPSGSHPAPAQPKDPAAPVKPVDTSWVDAHPLFSYQPPPAAPADSAEDHEDRFTPPPPPPLPKPAWPVLIAWLGLGYSILIMLAAVVGVMVPPWAGWMALIGFVGGMGLLFARLPRTRPPDAGDGAVL
ncbi:MAG TPA: hypothetical protein VFP89_03825 [Propionibacteriaceae bacterium]|nr:hypothetical protein [Propionibacteriaceae bacterium]